MRGGPTERAHTCDIRQTEVFQTRRDLRDAARKLEAREREEREALEKSRASEFGQSSGRVSPESGHPAELLSRAPLPN